MVLSKASIALFLCIVTFVSFIHAKPVPKDYYKILEIDRNATPQQIKKAYRKKAMKWHPDKHTEPKKKAKAEKLFPRLGQAYETLSDPEKRKTYDMFGEEGLKPGGGSGGGGGFNNFRRHGGGHNFRRHHGGGGGGRHGDFNFNFGGGGGGFGGGFQDIFSNMFGRGGGGGGSGHHDFGGGGFGRNQGGGFNSHRRERRREGSNSNYKHGYPFGDQFGPQPSRPSRPKEMYDFKEGNVKKLTPNHFPDRTDSKYTWIIHFFKKNNQQCYKLTEIFQKLAEKNKGMLRFGAIDCSEHEEFCARHKVFAHPTIMMFKGGRGDKYLGVVRAKPIQKWAKANMGKNIYNLRIRQNMDDFLKKDRSKKAHVVLLTDKYETSTIYKALSWKYRDSMSFGEVRASNKAFNHLFPAHEYPSMYVVLEYGDDPIIYEGAFTLDDLDQFLKGRSKEAQRRRAESKSRRKNRKARGGEKTYSTKEDTSWFSSFFSKGPSTKGEL